MKEIEKLEKEKSLFLKLRRLILGKGSPKFFVRIFFFLGLTGWTLFFLWGIASFLATFFIDEMNHSDKARAVFNTIGNKYDIYDFLSSFKGYVISNLISLLVVLLGLILIWREKMLGYAIYFIGYSAAIFVLPIFLGFSYMWNEVSMFDKIVYVIVTLPFVILFLFHLKQRNKDKESDLEQVIPQS